MPDPTVETRAAFSRRMDVSKAAVTQWAKAGRLVCDDDGKVIVEPSLERLRESGGSTRGGAHKGGLPGGAGDVKVAAGVAPGTLLAARTALATAQARKAETEQAARSGVLVERSRYAKALEDAMGPIFAAMAAVSALRGPDLAAETDVRKFQNMMDDVFDEIRRDIAATFRKLIDGPAGRQ